ncbi:HD domain-containing protein [Bacillus aerolatus]|uniref:HD domain-containing protein n=1 Tax=Bacillus aerolatus TaxID=2653354 RepID=A0A6I1FLD2_9BACI|nr:HD domain-containing phosphohydrolase [Bacillus aerolatus]KAB7707638.1 HD domain-containing protein [Bacillus aerolatus]
MYVKVEELKEGNVLLEDVISKAPEPLMVKDTILTSWHIKILEAFLIDKVAIGGASMGMVVENAGLPAEEKKRAAVPVQTKTNFFEVYLRSVDEYKKEFHKWQAGSGVDIIQIREIILPLLDEVTADPGLFSKLYQCAEKENYYCHHSVVTGLLSGAVAAQLNYEKGFVIQTALAGALADCGMARINPRILLKETSLTAGEKKEVDKHPVLSYKMVKDINLLNPETKIAVFQHHERMDGSGYVNGAKAENLPPISRIVAAADVFHAMTSDKLYRKRQTLFKVMEMFEQDFFGKFDLPTVKALTALFTKLASGTAVRLSDGQLANVLFMKQQHPTRPLLKLQANESIIDLEKRRDLHIEEVL